MINSLGKKFLEALTIEKPLRIIGTQNAYLALLAKREGYKALYLSGAGVANVSYGLPDLGMTTLDNVLEDARRIIEATNMPLLVDIDTGWGGSLMITRTIEKMCRIGVAAVHIEDQVFAKRCGHREGKLLVSKQEMCERIYAAKEGRLDSDFTIMARTDALGIEGLKSTIDRCLSYRDAGADMIFVEAATTGADYRALKEAVKIPILANMTEFGKTPLMTVEELSEFGVDIVLYPLTLMRAMNKTALHVLRTLKKEGTQKELLKEMQTRDELYETLDYLKWEERQRYHR